MPTPTGGGDRWPGKPSRACCGFVSAPSERASRRTKRLLLQGADLRVRVMWYACLRCATTRAGLGLFAVDQGAIGSGHMTIAKRREVVPLPHGHHPRWRGVMVRMFCTRGERGGYGYTRRRDLAR